MELQVQGVSQQEHNLSSAAASLRSCIRQHSHTIAKAEEQLQHLDTNGWPFSVQMRMLRGRILLAKPNARSVEITMRQHAVEIIDSEEVRKRLAFMCSPEVLVAMQDSQRICSRFKFSQRTSLL